MRVGGAVRRDGTGPLVRLLGDLPVTVPVTVVGQARPDRAVTTDGETSVQGSQPVVLPGRRARRLSVGVVAGGLLAAALAAGGTSLTSRVLAGTLTVGDVNDTVGFLVFAVVGAVILRRHPRHRVGWVFLTVGVLGAVGDAGTGYAVLGAQRTLPVVGVAAWFGAWLWAPPMGGFVLLLAWFPNGRALSRRWAVVAWVAVGATVAAAAIEATTMWSVRGPTLALLGRSHDRLLPAGVRPVMAVLSVCFLVAAVITVASQVVRERRSTGIERQQVKWLALWAIIAVPVLILNDERISSGVFHTITQLVSSPMWIAVAAGLAILRYRLYDIDRIISRTLSYAIVVAVLVGVYAAGVLGFGAVARAVTGESGDLVVAVSTLLVAAAFRPVVTRVRGLVDRRFNRAGVDAALAAEAFRARLRDEVELDTVLSDLKVTVHRVLAPSLVSVMTLDGPARPGDLA